MRGVIVIPSALSLLRLGLAAWFPLAAPALRPALLIAAALSDFVDGWIARRFKLATWLGGLLDALADKLFALAALLTFTFGAELTGWQAMLLLARDFAVALIALYAIVKRKWYAFRHMPARWFGKVTTAAMFLFFLLLATWPGQRQAFWPAFILTATLSFAAAIDYLIVFARQRQLDRRGAVRHT